MKGSMLTFSDTPLIVLSIIIGAYIIKRRQNANKRGIPLYYNKVEGRENEGGCCEPVPFSTNGHAVVSN